jgi:hypothetical protein
VFVVCSDDVEYAQALFARVPDAVVASGSDVDDFAMMTYCGAGILSASSYSWWAAYFASRRHADGRFLAPEFWIGHARGEWFPPGIQSSFLEYLSVVPAGGTPAPRTGGVP